VRENHIILLTISIIVVVSRIAAVDKTRLLEKIDSPDNAAVDKILDGCSRVLDKKIF